MIVWYTLVNRKEVYNYEKENTYCNKYLRGYSYIDSGLYAIFQKT